MTPRQRSWLVAALLGVLGYLLNALGIPMVPDLHARPGDFSPGLGILFGSVPALVAAVAYGAGPGALAGAIAASRTLAAWGHGYGLLMITLEAVLVGALRRRVRPVFAVALFWALIGLPLGFVIYRDLLDISGPMVAVVLLKQPLNELLNALLAEAALLSMRVRRWLEVSDRLAVREYLGTVTALAAMLPLLALSVLEAHDEWATSVSLAREHARAAVFAATAALADHLQDHRQGLRAVTAQLAVAGSLDEAALRALIDELVRAGRHFLHVLLVDETGAVQVLALRGTSAFSPPAPLLALGALIRGPFFDELRAAPPAEIVSSRMLIDPVTGRLTVLLGSALEGGGTGRYLVGVLDVKRLTSLLPTPPPTGPGVRVASLMGVLVGASGRARPTTPIDLARRPGYRLARRMTLAAAVPRPRVGLTMYQRSSSRRPWRVGNRALLAAHRLDDIGWLVWSRVPFDRVFGTVATGYVRVNVLLLAALFATLGLGHLIARLVSRPLDRLVAATDRLAMSDLSTRVDPRVYDGAPAELAALATSFNAMASRVERAQRESERAVRENQEAVAAKERFFSAAAHDLRTPISAVKGYCDLLEMGVQGELAPRQRQALGRIRESADHLLQLVDDLLDLSRLASGRLELESEPVDPQALIEEVAAIVRPGAEAKGLALILEQQGVVDRTEVDPLRVKQILLNLLSNAVKFTDSGWITVAWGPGGGREGAQPPGFYIVVGDTGPGIPEDAVERIFGEFEQTELGKARRGTGLGLTISRRLARRLGGDLWVESRPGAGSRFTLWLPAPAAE